MPIDIPLISEELKNYLKELFGDNIAQKYLQKIVSPMEEYSLHVYRDVSIIDVILENLRENGFEARQHNDFPNMVVVSPKGPFELSLKEDSKEIVVDNRAAEMIYQGSDVFAPGVKRANRVKAGDIVNIVNQNDIFVAQAEAVMSHNQMMVEKKGIAAKNILSPYIVPSLESLDNKSLPVYFQSLPAYLAVMNLDPQPDERILDCCAAPGNKTLHLNELTKDQARIVAVDRSKRRIQKIQEKIETFKTSNIITKVGNIIALSKEWGVKFDKILVDPPCSSLGLRPRLVHDISTNTIKSIADYQKAIFYACDNLLKSKGILVYSTCTITKEENEEIINYAVQKLNYTVLEQNFMYSKADVPIGNFNFPVQRFIPGIDKTLGYFIAKLKKS
ncbi:MAG: methyltransferase domain-containing protein [Candidatus Heimdallarchaeota archaeon]|nr:methyltransferase domain-containing protein [Candidatus Heimdallarchaeota archaeon]